MSINKEWSRSDGPQQSIFSELADCLVSQPTLKVIAAHKVPPDVQQHIHALLEKNREVGLSQQERLEVEISW